MIEEGLSSLAIAWQNLARGSVNRRIFAAILTVGTFSGAVKVGYMAQGLVAAAVFGTGDHFDAFVIALAVPLFAINVIGTSFNAAVLPVFTAVLNREGREGAQELLSSVVTLSALVLASVVVLLGLVGRFLVPLMATGFSPHKLALAETLFYILIPSIFFKGLSTTWGGILNADDRFALAASAEVVAPLASIVCVIAFHGTSAVYGLAGGLVAGFVLQTAILGRALAAQGWSPRPRVRNIHPAARKVVNQYVPLVLGSLIWSVSILVDQAMASSLPRGSVSALNYGTNMVTAASAIGTVALATAVLPYFSRMVAAQQWSGLRHSVRTYGVLVVAVAVPLAALAVVLSSPLVQLVYERGAFSHADVALVSRVQTFFVLQLPFLGLSVLFVRLLSALQANHLMAWSSVGAVIANVALNYVFMQRMGVAGIALSTSCVYALNCGFLFAVSWRMIRKMEAAGEGIPRPATIS